MSIIAPPAYFTVNQIAARFKLPIQRIYGLIELGFLFAIKINLNGKHDVTLVPVAAVEVFETTHLAAPEMINLEQRTATLEAKVETISSSSGYYSIKAWARLNRLSMPNLRAKAIGKACAQLCRERSLEIGKARDEAFGEVNTYPESIIAEVFRVQADLGFLGR